MSKRTRPFEEDDDGEAEERLRSIPDGEAQDLMDVVETAHEQGVPPLVLLSIMDMGSEARDLIVRAAMPNIHAFLRVDVALHQAVRDTLGDLFRRGVRDAVRRLQAWAGHTWGDVSTFLGELTDLLFTNPSLPPAWFLREFGGLLGPLYEPNPEEDEKLEIAIPNYGTPRRSRIMWIFMEVFHEAFFNVPDTTYDSDAARRFRRAADSMQVLLNFWMNPLSPGRDVGWHALLWTLVARYQLVVAGDDFLRHFNRHSYVAFLESFACTIMVVQRLTLPGLDFVGVDIGTFTTRGVFCGYWFQLPPSLLSLRYCDTPLLIQAYRHRHPEATEPTPLLYRCPTLALFLERRGEYDPDNGDDYFSQVALQDAPDMAVQGHDLAETFFPLDIYTDQEWKEVVLTLTDESRDTLLNVNGSLWPMFRADITRRLWQLVIDLPTLPYAAWEELRHIYIYVVSTAFTFDSNLVYDLLRHIPGPRPPDLLLLFLYWFLYHRPRLARWILEPSLVDDRPILDLAVDLHFTPGSNVVTFLTGIMGAVPAYVHARTVSGRFPRAFQAEFRELCASVFLRLVEQVPAGERSHVFYHGFSARETAGAILQFAQYRGGAIEDLHLGQRLLLRGSRDPPREVFRVLQNLLGVEGARGWERIWFPRRDPEDSLSEAEVEEEELATAAAKLITNPSALSGNANKKKGQQKIVF